VLSRRSRRRPPEFGCVAGVASLRQTQHLCRNSGERDSNVIEKHNAPLTRYERGAKTPKDANTTVAETARTEGRLKHAKSAKRGRGSPRKGLPWPFLMVIFLFWLFR